MPFAKSSHGDPRLSGLLFTFRRLQRFRKGFLLVGAVMVAGGAYYAGKMYSAVSAAEKEESLIAVAWRDGSVGPAFYGAFVRLEPLTKGYSVRAFIKIGRCNGYTRDCGELGTVSTAEEGVAKWGYIDWRIDGLHIGHGSSQYFLPRKDVETHR